MLASVCFYYVYLQLPVRRAPAVIRIADCIIVLFPARVQRDWSVQDRYAVHADLSGQLLVRRVFRAYIPALEVVSRTRCHRQTSVRLIVAVSLCSRRYRSALRVERYQIILRLEPRPQLFVPSRTPLDARYLYSVCVVPAQKPESFRARTSYAERRRRPLIALGIVLAAAQIQVEICVRYRTVPQPVLEVQRLYSVIVFLYVVPVRRVVRVSVQVIRDCILLLFPLRVVRYVVLDCNHRRRKVHFLAAYRRRVPARKRAVRFCHLLVAYGRLYPLPVALLEAELHSRYLIASHWLERYRILSAFEEYPHVRAAVAVNRRVDFARRRLIPVEFVLVAVLELRKRSPVAVHVRYFRIRRARRFVLVYQPRPYKVFQPRLVRCLRIFAVFVRH